MDNFKIDITAEGRESLHKILEICLQHNAPGKRIESYQILELETGTYFDVPKDLENINALVFRWMKDEKPVINGPVNLPFRLDAAGATDFAMRWLEECKWPKEPDHDGDNKKGWRVYTGAWGHVGGDRDAVCAILPQWSMYGK